ncbi:MAG: CDP-alcohol phosphatidyltransferase family protein [Clostridia bacterium]|nr:CDP-alcohol phosphatidyltransferase family protein [Clostridia bacterium]
MLAYIPNIITSTRIFGTVCMMFTEPFSRAFFIVYTLTGLSDVLDGTIARLTKTTSAFGAKLDSVADLLFYITMFFMIVGRLFGMLPPLLWCLFFLVVGLRIFAYLAFAKKFKSFASSHTILNKVTGAAVFATPYVMATSYIVPFCTVMGIVSLVSVLRELYTYLSIGKV